jgi:hypothetical protein
MRTGSLYAESGLSKTPDPETGGKPDEISENMQGSDLGDLLLEATSI